MKKVLFIALFVCSLSSMAQAKKTAPKHTVKIETKELTIAQYDFFKSIKDKYPTFVFPDKIENIYIDGQLIQSQFEMSDKTANVQCIVQPDNNTLSYEAEVINVENYRITFTRLGQTIIKTEILENKSEYNVYFDGKKEL